MCACSYWGVCVFACWSVSVCLLVLVCGHMEDRAGCCAFPNLSTLMFEIRLSVSVSSWIWLGWLSTVLQRSTCPHSLALVLQTYTDVPDFSSGAEDPNSSPLACVANTWLTKPSPAQLWCLVGPRINREARPRPGQNVFVVWGILSLRSKCL